MTVIDVQKDTTALTLTFVAEFDAGYIHRNGLSRPSGCSAAGFAHDKLADSINQSGLFRYGYEQLGQ